jgi:hypothetical protein
LGMVFRRLRLVVGGLLLVIGLCLFVAGILLLATATLLLVTDILLLVTPILLLVGSTLDSKPVVGLRTPLLEMDPRTRREHVTRYGLEVLRRKGKGHRRRSHGKDRYRVKVEESRLK